MSLVEQALGKLRAAEGTTATHAGMAQGAVRQATSSETPLRSLPSYLNGRALQVDPEMLRTAGLLPPLHREKQLRFEFRQIKRRLLDAALGRGLPALDNGRVIAVTSSLPGEGKSFVSMNLAVSVAREQQTRVLLIDADCQKRNISEAMGIADRRGLIDAIRGDDGHELASLILPTSIEGLMVVPSGSQTESYTEILASQALAVQVRELVESDPELIVIIDTSPLLVTTEASAAIAAAGQVVFVIRAEHTEQRSVDDALRLIGERAGVSMLLNQGSPALGEHDYYSDYGQAYK